jgi:hypothetical protein
VQVVIPREQGDLRIGVSVNGCWPVFEKAATMELHFPVGPYTQHVPENQAYNFEFKASEILEGWNRILIYNNEKAKDGQSVRIVSLELGVKA